MGILSSLRGVFGPSIKKSNLDLVQIINAEIAKQEAPKNIDDRSAYLKSTIILPIIAGSHDFTQDKFGNINFQPDAKVFSVSSTIDDWQVFIGFVEPEAIQYVPLPSLTRFAKCRFSDLPQLMETSEADGTAIFLYTNKGSVGLSQEQIRRIIDEPQKIYEPIGLIEARKNYRDIKCATELSFSLREQLYGKLVTMAEVSSVWLGHLVDRGNSKYFILFDYLGSSKAIYEELKPFLMPELNGKELIHFRYFDGFSPWIISHLPPFYSKNDQKLSGWGLDIIAKNVRTHNKKRRPSFKKTRLVSED